MFIITFKVKFNGINYIDTYEHRVQSSAVEMGPLNTHSLTVVLMSKLCLSTLIQQV